MLAPGGSVGVTPTKNCLVLQWRPRVLGQYTPRLIRPDFGPWWLQVPPDPPTGDYASPLEGAGGRGFWPEGLVPAPGTPPPLTGVDEPDPDGYSSPVLHPPRLERSQMKS